jgi:serine protease
MEGGMSPRKNPPRGKSKGKSKPDTSPVQIVVKLKDTAPIPAGRSPVEYFTEALKRLDSSVPGLQSVTLTPLLTVWSLVDIERSNQKATETDSTYKPSKLNYYLTFEAPPGTELDRLLALLNALDDVVIAYVNPPGESPHVKPRNRRKSLHQGYLDPAPTGIGIRDIRPVRGGAGIPGADGNGVPFVDIELGWLTTHGDLPRRKIRRIFGEMIASQREHGTNVLGIVAALDNRRDCIGIAPGVASIGLSSYAANRQTNRVDAIAEAIRELEARGGGGVILIEGQLTGTALPWEALDAEFDIIEHAVARGMVVVAAAGNSRVDLDTYRDPQGRAVFQRDFRDSGAILVGAATSAVPHARTPVSNFGSRVDCYAWGENVVTLSTNGPGPTTSDFSGTSSAAAIIAGAAISVQGIALQQIGRQLSPLRVRELLSNRDTGTLSAGDVKGARSSDHIGVMPNLAAMSKKIV